MRKGEGENWGGEEWEKEELKVIEPGISRSWNLFFFGIHPDSLQHQGSYQKP